jgi:hypothetical protein
MLPAASRPLRFLERFFVGRDRRRVPLHVTVLASSKHLAPPIAFRFLLCLDRDAEPVSGAVAAIGALEITPIDRGAQGAERPIDRRLPDGKSSEEIARRGTAIGVDLSGQATARSVSWPTNL